jgi:hypothetical protein
MKRTTKNYSLTVCLFLFLLIVIGSGLKLTPMASFIAGATGTPLVIAVWNRHSAKMFERFAETIRRGDVDHELDASRAREATLRDHLSDLVLVHHQHYGHKGEFEDCTMAGCRAYREMLGANGNSKPAHHPPESTIA